MMVLLGSALIFGGLLGLRYRSTILILVLPMAFVLPCGLALAMDAGMLSALASAFLMAVAVQLGFLAGGVAAAEPDKGIAVPSSSHWRRRGV